MISTFSCDIALLLQPHGFEGLVMVEEVLNVRDDAITDRVDAGDIRRHLDAASDSVSTPVAANQHPTVLADGYLPDLPAWVCPRRPDLQPTFSSLRARAA